MGLGARLVVAVAWLAVAAALDKKFNITVGYLASLHNGGQGLTISGALTTALEELNNSTDILPDVRLGVEWHWHDTNWDLDKTTQLLTNMSRSEVVAIFGPEGRCRTESPEVQARNLPMIAYKCSDYQTTTKSNFAILEQPDEQLAKSVISLLRYYRWNKFSLLYGEAWEAAALTLASRARQHNMTLNHQRSLMSGYKCCEKMLPCCTPNFWHQLIRDTKDNTRIYVLLGEESDLSDMMEAMDRLRLFDKGIYMVIFVDIDMYKLYNPKRTHKYWMSTTDFINNHFKTACPSSTPELKKRTQSLLVVTLPEATSSFKDFAAKVRHHNQIEPFNFAELRIAEKHISIYAAYLYDSVIMYATALDALIKEASQKGELTYDKLMGIATNGSRIVAKMTEKTPYISTVSGMSIRLDDSVYTQNRFSVLALGRVQPSDDHNCSYNIIPVGELQQDAGEYPRYKLNPR